MKSLVIAEHNNEQLNLVTLNVINAADKLNTELDVLVIGNECKKVAEHVSKIKNVNKVLLVESNSYSHFLAENIAQVVIKISSSYDYLFAPATTFGKNLMPRIAALLDVDQISDIISIENDNCFKRPIYAGNAIETVQTDAYKKVITVRYSCFDAAPESDTTASIEQLNIEYNLGLSSFVSEEIEEKDRPDLTSAKTVISGGRALGNSENFELLYKLADKLGAAVGATRAAVDAGFVSNDMQVGQTGKVVAPDLYIAVGISGAIQHIAGMKGSKVIVAINKDPDAPIFQVADFGLVGDLFEIIPELTRKI